MKEISQRAKVYLRLQDTYYICSQGGLKGVVTRTIIVVEDDKLLPCI
jgi:hypothetical protein